MRLEVVGQLVSFLEACKSFLMFLSQLEVSMVIPIPTNVITSSNLVGLLVLAMVHHKWILNKPILSSLERSITVTLLVKDIRALAHTSHHRIHNNPHNQHHMDNLRNRWEVPCLGSH
jgi:hypothetical protein